MQRRIQTIGLNMAPIPTALLAVLLEPRLTAWMHGREAALPLAVCLLLAALLHPRLRHLLIITLCYGVSFLALRDAFFGSRLALPPTIDYDNLEQGRLFALIVVAALSATAAAGETIRPGTVWARRCYFGAAAIYFAGSGFIDCVWRDWHVSWKGILLCTTGVIALIGCLYAPRIVASEQEAEQEEAVNDEALQEARENAHRIALRAKEWRETPAPNDDDGSRNLPPPTASPTALP